MNFDTLFCKLLQKQKGRYNYASLQDYLKRSGNPAGISPSGFMLLKLLLPFMIFVVFLSMHILLPGILFVTLSFYLPDLAIRFYDRKTMRDIRIELADVYDLINIQTSAGVHISIALSEAFLIISSRRLKKALTSLSAEIAMKNEIEQALDNFVKNFRSSDIDNFSMTIKQSLITGQSRQVIDDISNIIKEMNTIEMQEKTRRIRGTVSLIELLIFLGILVIIVFGLFGEIVRTWSVTN